MTNVINDSQCKRDVLILDCTEIGCPLVLQFVYIELCGAFQRNGHIVKKINNINQIHNNSIVLMGDTFRVNNPSELLNKQSPYAIYIGWYWDRINTSCLKYFIYTYENMLNPSALSTHVNRFKVLKGNKNNYPLLLRANEDIKNIGNLEKKIEYVYCYMGFNYYPILEPKKYKGIYNAPSRHEEYLSYELRKNIYLSSIFALGIQGKENIASQHVSQRIYEGMAYGCIVLTNSKPVCEQTNNIPVYVENLADIENKIDYYMSNQEKLKEKQLQGYEYVKEFGTNNYSIKQYNDLIEQLYNIKI